MTTEIIAFNFEDACNMSVVIKDGELYPAYKVQSSIMAEYLMCNAEDLDGILTSKLPFLAAREMEQLLTWSNFLHNLIWSYYLSWLSILKNYFKIEQNEKYC